MRYFFILLQSVIFISTSISAENQQYPTPIVLRADQMSEQIIQEKIANYQLNSLHDQNVTGMIQFYRDCQSSIADTIKQIDFTINQLIYDKRNLLSIRSESLLNIDIKMYKILLDTVTKKFNEAEKVYLNFGVQMQKSTYSKSLLNDYKQRIDEVNNIIAILSDKLRLRKEQISMMYKKYSGQRCKGNIDSCLQKTITYIDNEFSRLEYSKKCIKQNERILIDTTIATKNAAHSISLICKNIYLQKEIIVDFYYQKVDTNYVLACDTNILYKDAYRKLDSLWIYPVFINDSLCRYISLFKFQIQNDVDFLIVNDTALAIDEKPGMAWIPGGSFIMGSNNGKFDEKPTHLVTLRGFYIDKTEVTQMEYEKQIGPINSSGLPGFEKCPSCPVTMVSWKNATNYCSKIGKRLPTEAEWEYAAGGGSKTSYFWGDSLNPAYLWYGSNSGKKIHQVATCKPNHWGLYDMIGNVSEWCNDTYCANYYLFSPIFNPKGFFTSWGNYVVRGSNFNDVDSSNMRTSARGAGSDGIKSSVIGFRCASSK